MQYVKFPMSTLRITQGYGLEVDGVSTSVSGGTYSHKGAYALDLGGADTGADYLYAPCDVTVKRIYTASGTNTTWFQTNGPVMCADGQARELVFMLCHANNSTMSELGITVGKTFAQGEKFYKEGTGGGVSTHCHLEVGLAPFTGTGWYKSSYVDDRGYNVWIINNKVIPSDIFYLTSDTKVVKDMGYNWRYLNEYTKYGTPMGIRVLSGTGKNVQYFNTPDVNDVAGSNLPESSEYTALGHTISADASGFIYVKFIYDDGNEYWMAILDDRVELFERDSYIEFSTPMGVRILTGTGKNVEYFNSADVNDVAGSNLPEGAEYIALGQTTVTDDNGFTFVKFIYSDNQEYWMAILNDRIELFQRIVSPADSYVDFSVSMGVRVLTGTGKNVQYFNTLDVNDIAGSNLPEGSEYTALGKTTVADDNGFTYVKFIYTDNNQYWMAILDDRIELFEKISEDQEVQLTPIDSYVTFSTPMIVRVLVSSGKNVQYFNTIDVDDIAGGNLPEGSEYVALGKTTVADVNGFTYVKFVHSNGNEYWMANLDDRIELLEGSEIAFTEMGIDVSDYQGVIDWQKVAETGKKFAIIKAVGTNTNGTYISQYWGSNYQGCKDNGIKVGAYLYTYAYNTADADVELSYLFRALKGKKFEYPIFIDVEDKLLYQNCTVEVLTNTVKHLCQKLKEKGYYPAIYTYSYFAKTYLNMSELTDYDLWIADYTGSVTYQGDYTMWQYTSTGSVDGIEGNVDLDISYKDYSNLIKNEEGGKEMATQTLKMTIQLRRDTTANWELYKDIVPAAGEPCFDLELGTLKIGDGIKTYEQLDPIGTAIVAADGKSIVLTDGVFKLAGFDAAGTGAQPRKNADGELEWIVPTGATNEELQALVSGLQNDVKTLQDIVTPTGEGTTPLLDRVEAIEAAMTGTGAGSVDEKINTAFDDFMAKVSDDGTVNTVKELIDYVADHAPEAAQMAADITSLQGLVGKTSVNDQIVAAIATSEAKADALFKHVKYEITSKPAEALVNYREKEIRIMCPADTQFTQQAVGPTGDASKYYVGFKAYAPAGAVSFKEDLKTTIEDTTMYYFEGNDFAGTDIYGRKYSIVWLPVAKYDEATGTWTYYGKNSSAAKYIGWYYSVEWYGADGRVMDSDTIRINLTNEACHNAVEPHFMGGVVKGVSVGGTLLDMVNGKVDVPVGAGLKASEEIEIAKDGTLGIGTINVSKLVTDGTELVLDGGGATN